MIDQVFGENFSKIIEKYENLNSDLKGEISNLKMKLKENVKFNINFINCIF